MSPRQTIQLYGVARAALLREVPGSFWNCSPAMNLAIGAPVSDPARWCQAPGSSRVGDRRSIGSWKTASYFINPEELKKVEIFGVHF